MEMGSREIGEGNRRSGGGKKWSVCRKEKYYRIHNQ